MPVKNDDFYKNLDNYIDQASASTDKKLASYISSITSLKDSEILSLFPDESSMQDLADLIAMVSSATNNNKKVAQFSQNVDKFGGVAVKLISNLLV